MKSFTVTKRSIKVGIPVDTDETEKIIKDVLKTFESNGLTLEGTEDHANLMGTIYVVGLGDRQEDDACQIAYHFGRALSKEFCNK